MKSAAKDGPGNRADAEQSIIEFSLAMMYNGNTNKIQKAQERVK